VAVLEQQEVQPQVMMELQILAVAVAVDHQPMLHSLTAVMAVQVLSSFVTQAVEQSQLARV
jgi:hypothetical protein